MPKVLCVEDEKAQSNFLADILALKGFEVKIAKNGVKGIEQARAWLPDLILIDLRMPHMDGFEAMRVIRSEVKTANIPIIVVSAWTSTTERAEALAAGANEYFPKPIDIDRLLTTIPRYLRRLSGEASVTELERQRQEEMSEAEIQAVYAEQMELAYQLEIWQDSPEIAVTLTQLTQLTSGLIHDLRNRLGLLRNYTPRADYCLRLLEGLALLRFKPSLSRQLHQGNQVEPEITVEDLTAFGLDNLQVEINPQREEDRTGLTIKGLMDKEMIKRGLWLLLQGLAGKLSNNHQSQIKGARVEITDKRLDYPQFGFYITISVKAADVLLTKGAGFRNVLLGEEVAICLFLLQKVIFLNGGTISVVGIDKIEIKNPADFFVPRERGLEDLRLSIDRLTNEASTSLSQYDGSIPDVSPLIKGFVSALLRELANIAEEANEVSGKGTQEVIQRNCSYAQLLLQNLLWLGAGIDLPNEAVDVADTLQSVREIMRDEIGGRPIDNDDGGVEVKLDLQPNLPQVRANQVCLQQVFVNLISNALEAMPESGTLTLRAFRAGSEVHMEVCDTGAGIASEKIDHIFETTFSTKQGQEHGTGLYVVKSIVDKLGGRIEVTSRPGEGTMFRICLQGS